MATWTETPPHQHHWVIAEPNGRWSEAECKHCHGLRTFQNWLPDADFTTRGERFQEMADERASQRL